jgi:hypothetical protein
MRNNQNYDSKNDNFLLPLGRKDPIVESRNFIFHHRQINFLICQSRFWCASYLYGCYSVAETCPLCGNTSSSNIESIPISNQEEAFEFEYNHLRGISLNFFTSHKNTSST